VVEQALEPVDLVAKDRPALPAQPVEPPRSVVVLFGSLDFGD
jgi:hypothetical protein